MGDPDDKCYYDGYCYIDKRAELNKKIDKELKSTINKYKKEMNR